MVLSILVRLELYCTITFLGHEKFPDRKLHDLPGQQNDTMTNGLFDEELPVG